MTELKKLDSQWLERIWKFTLLKKYNLTDAYNFRMLNKSNLKTKFIKSQLINIFTDNILFKGLGGVGQSIDFPC